MLLAEIRVEGCLDARWSEWFEDLTIELTPQGETILTGPVQDTAALYGLLSRLRDLGLGLISVNTIQG